MYLKKPSDLDQYFTMVRAIKELLVSFRRFAAGCECDKERILVVPQIPKSPNLNETWMEQMARNAVDDSGGALRHFRFVLHDRDCKFCASFRAILTSAGVAPLALPPRSPNLSAFAER